MRYNTRDIPWFPMRKNPPRHELHLSSGWNFAFVIDHTQTAHNSSSTYKQPPQHARFIIFLTRQHLYLILILIFTSQVYHTYIHIYPRFNPNMSSKGQLIVSADGTKIWAQAAGNPNKPAVVFIHGFSCTGLHFSKQFSDPKLLENLYLIRYDVRGHGRSDQPLEAKDYESLRHAQDFKAVIEAFGAEKPFVAGWYVDSIRQFWVRY